MSLINRTILIEKSRAPLARALAAGLSSGGVGMFETPLYRNGQIAYYVSSGFIDEAFGVVLNDANALFAACGVNATLPQCQDLISTSIVVDCDVEDAYSTFNRLGVIVDNTQ